ncbi:uncharacterized protein BXZ73DRAFT_86153 [Epithele typhae]|uniref:uncharacterized protein n=1 Tax=Epithele typhae TaxID=378194 RepID=UPI00200818E3|nr:uncharacterized protein BXZ73DRAFT_86153 [Epithele typhae]KAH9945891.1 hypothetical protein BXZ73DRAFT_86153 [Epithele typhae]
MDPAMPVTVAKGALLTCDILRPAAVTAGTLTGSYAFLKSYPDAIHLAMRSATNGGVAGSLFFGTSPKPASGCRRRRELHASRMHKLPETAISGAFTGGVIGAYRSTSPSVHTSACGPSAVWAGARTIGIICTVLQLAFNELEVNRVKFVAAQRSRKNSIFDGFMTMIGFRRVSHEEHIEKLKKQRDEALKRIAILEGERLAMSQLEGETGKSC